MRIILLQDIPKVGYKYEIKNVANGHARNFLIAKGIAELATPQAIKRAALQKKNQDQKKNKQITMFKKSLQNLNGKKITISASANNEGGLFAKIGRGEIEKILKENNYPEIEQDSILLDTPIKKTGEHAIKINKKGGKAEFVLEITGEARGV